jgi:uncharacterized protein YegP (UPF0339 family)
MSEIAKAPPSAKASLSASALKVRPVTINQVVGYNIAWYRKAARLTQEQLGQRLGGWTKVAVSAAERSWYGKRARKFDADEVVAIARALGIPVLALFLPPDDAGTAVIYQLGEVSEVEQPIQLTELLPYILPSPGKQTPVMAAFRKRLMALGAAYPAETGQPDSLNADVKVSGESIERDGYAEEFIVLDELAAQRTELERRVADLRDFEREYRSRLLTYLEDLVSALRNDEQTDKHKFVIKKSTSSGRYYFNLVGANGQVLATSGVYPYKQSVLDAIREVGTNAYDAAIDDQASE